MKAQLFLLMNCYRLMMSFLDNLNLSQLSRASGHLLKLARPGVFHRLPFSSRHFHLFSHINPIICCLCLVRLNQPPFGTFSSSATSASLDLFTAHALCHWVEEITREPTPGTGQARGRYCSSSCSFPEMPRLELPFCQTDCSFWQHVFPPFLTLSPPLLKLGPYEWPCNNSHLKCSN